MVLLRGHKDKLHVLVESSNLNGLLGIILEDSVSVNAVDYVLVRINKSLFHCEKRLFQWSNIKAAHDDFECNLQVLWTYIRKLNTGQHSIFAEVIVDAYEADHKS